MSNETIDRNDRAVKALAEVKAAFEALLPETIEPRTAIEFFRTVSAGAEKLETTPDLQEFTAETVAFGPVFTGQLLMEILPSAPDHGQRMSAMQKAFWLQVAEYMGPDWIDEFRKVGAFMSKVDSF